MRRAPARPVCASLCDSDALFQRSHLKLHTSHCTLHTSHFALTLHTPHFISSHLIWALLTSSHLFSYVIQVLLKYFSFHLSTAQPFSSLRSSSQLISALLHVDCQIEFSCTQIPLRAESFCTQKLETQMRLHRKALTHRKLLHMGSTQQAFAQKSFYTEKRLCAEKLLHREAFRDRCVYARKLLQREAFTHRSLLTEPFTY